MLPPADDHPLGTTGPNPIAPRYRTGSAVTWGSNTLGYVRAVYTESVTLTLNGYSRTRFASPLDPAYLLERSDGTMELRSEYELDRA